MSIIDTLSQRVSESQAARWFAAQTPRDRSLLALLAGFLAVVFLWLAVWQPVSQWHDRAVSTHQRLQGDLEFMQRTASRARGKAQSSQAERGRSRPTLTIITRSAASAGLNITRARPEGGGETYSVTFEGKPFNDILQWLSDLSANNGIVVRDAQVSTDSTPGYVNARFALQ
ncbi:MAG: type II secretion system protein M [Pseudomonadaceae bacterium]|nr:type II secretion system protein M [Pseudomonadaceae bacterium]